MALYEFVCEECGGKTEVILSPEKKETHIVTCVKCGKKMKPVEFSKVSPFKWGKGGGWN